MAEDNSLSVDSIKKEPEECPSDDLESIDHCFGDDSSVKEEPTEKDGIEAAKSDDDMQGYDTRSEVASSVSSDSDSGDGMSSKSFDIKRKRHTKPSNVSKSVQDAASTAAPPSVSRKNDSISPLKRNSDVYIGKLNYLFRDARFFIIKSSNAENIALSKTKGVWATLPQNQLKLSEAFRSSQNVILIFSAKESGKFSGFARLATGVDRSISPVRWVVPAELTPNLLKGTFRIDWICRNDLPFSFTTALYNPWNCSKPVKIARDGQEVEPRVAERLCRLFPEDESIDMAPILRKSKEAAKSRGLITTRGSGGPADVGKALYTAKYRVKMLQHQSLQHPHAHHKSHSGKEGIGGRNKTFLHQQHHHRMYDVAGGGRVSKHYKRGGAGLQGSVTSKGGAAYLETGKDGSGRALRGRVITSIETYVKRFGHAFRPPPMAHPPGPAAAAAAAAAMAMPFMQHPHPHPHPGSEMFSQFGHLPPFPPPPAHLPRYYEPVPPPSAASFAHFSKLNPLHAAAAAAASGAVTKKVYDRSMAEFLRKTREKEYYSKKENRSATNSTRRKDGENSKSRKSHFKERR